MTKTDWEKKFDKEFTYIGNGLHWAWGVDTQTTQINKIKHFIRQELKREKKRVLEDIKDWLHAETVTIKADFNGYLEDCLKESNGSLH